MEKKAYQEPQMEVILLETAGMLAVSTELGEDATGRALAPIYDEDE